MAKTAASKDSPVPRIGIPLAPGYFGKMEPRNSAKPSPKPDKIQRKELIEALRSTGTGWDAEAKELLAIPEMLFKLEAEDATYYCASDDFSGLFHVLSALASGKKIEALPEFGLALYSTGGSVFLVFADAHRNIVLKEKMFCVHEQPHEKSWEVIRLSLRELIKAANEKTIAVHNLGLTETIASG
jgi:hypothetical protein